MRAPLRSPTPRLRLVSDDAAPGPRPKGSRRPHRNETVARVRKLIETTPLTYGEIAAETGVGRASICRWTRDGGWRRHLFAPRATDTVPRERAGARLRLRTLAALAERTVRELEETPGVDVDKLGEALALYQMAKLAARPRKRSSPFVPAKAGTQESRAQGQRALDSRLRGNEREDPAPSSPDAPPGLRLLAEMRAAGVDLDYAPEETIKDYIVSRRYENPALRPRNRTRRERHDDWMREKE